MGVGRGGALGKFIIFITNFKTTVINVIINGIIFVIYLSESLLLVYTYATGFLY